MSITSLQSAKNYLKVNENPNDSTFDDAPLQTMLDAAEGVISDLIGPLTAVAVTERLLARNGSLSLGNTPVISLTSVTDVWGGVALDVTTLQEVDAVVGYSTGLPLPRSTYDVTYQAGRGVLTSRVQAAIYELLRELTKGLRGPYRGPAAQAPQPVAGDLPKRVLWLLSGEMAGGEFA